MFFFVYLLSHNLYPVYEVNFCILNHDLVFKKYFPWGFAGLMSASWNLKGKLFMSSGSRKRWLFCLWKVQKWQVSMWRANHFIIMMNWENVHKSLSSSCGINNPCLQCLHSWKTKNKTDVDLDAQFLSVCELKLNSTSLVLCRLSSLLPPLHPCKMSDKLYCL